MPKEKEKSEAKPSFPSDVVLVRGHNSRDREALSASERKALREYAARQAEPQDGMGERGDGGFDQRSDWDK